MLYKSIEFHNNGNERLVEKILSSSYDNPYVLENTFFDVHFTIDSKTILHDMIGLTYRFLWEQMYLRRTNQDYLSVIEQPPTFHGENDRDPLDSAYSVMLKVSIGEALDYIYRVTPPIFLERTKKSLGTINDVLSMVNFYLSDEKASDYKYKLEMFNNVLNMRKFETKWNYDNNRFDVIEKNFQSNIGCPTGVIDISDQPISYYKSHMNVDDKDWFIKGYDLQMSIRFPMNNALVEDDIIRILNYAHILNAMYDETSNNLYVSAYTNKLNLDLCVYIGMWYNKCK